MANLTKTVDGKALPAEKFAYVGDPKDISTWHLPIDSDHIDSALKMFGHEKHVPASAKGAVARKIASTAKSAGLDTKDFESKYCSGSEHADFGNGWIEIFRAGDYGAKGSFTSTDLDRIIANYDPDFHEAPACVGHPKDDLPAYGWASRLMRNGDTLLAKFKEVDPAFEEAVLAGRYKKRSAAFYKDDAGRISNLRHVAFLGAQPPEVKGLKNLNFDDAGRQFLEVEFGEEESVEVNKETIGQAVTAWFAEHFGIGRKPGDATATFSEADVKRIAAEAATAAATPLQAKITELETTLKNQGTQFSERETKIAGAEVKQRATESINRVKAKGAWLPAFALMGIDALFAELAKRTDTVEFGEGDGKKTQTPLEIFTNFMESLPRFIPGGRVVTGATPAAGRSSVNFTEGRGVKADQNSIALNAAAEKRAKEKNITFAEALNQIVTEQPELTLPGGSQAGAV